MKKSLLFVLIIFCFSNSKAQYHYWTKKIGGDDNEYSRAINVDGAGSVYVAGVFSGVLDFDPGPATNTLASVSLEAMFLTKMDSVGNFVWSRKFNGTKDVEPTAVKVGSQGDIFITGTFEGSADFDPGTGIFSMTSTPGLGTDAFIIKLNSSGNFVWARSFGGKMMENSAELVLDANDNIFVAGNFGDTADFDPGLGVFTLIAQGSNSSAFVSKLDASGNFVWARSFRHTNTGSGSWGSDLCVDAAGEITITGGFYGNVDFDPGLNTFTLGSVPTGTFVDSNDMFVVRLNSSGNLQWARCMGSENQESGNSVVADVFGNVYLTGNFNGTMDIDPGSAAYNLVSNDNNDIFICSLTSQGLFIWAGSFGGSNGNPESAYLASIQPGGDIFLTGVVNGTPDFNIGSGVFTQPVQSPDGNVFVLRMTTSGNFVWATIFPGSKSGIGTAIESAPGNNVYLTGNYSNLVNFDPGVSNVMYSSYKVDFFIQRRGPLSTVGIEDYDFNRTISIYPNPANDKLQVLTNKLEQFPVSYIFVDLFGREVIHGLCRSENEEIDINKIPPGLYFVQLVSGERITIKKLIVR